MNRSLKIILLYLFGIFLLGFEKPQVKTLTVQSKTESIHAFIKSQITPFISNPPAESKSDHSGFPSMVVGVILPNSSQIFTYGTLPQLHRPPQSSDVYPLNSITKILTGLILAKGIIHGDFQKSTLISTLLNPDLSPFVGPRRLGQVVSHYASYQAMPGNLSRTSNPAAPASNYSRNDLKLCLSNPLCSEIKAPIGSTYQYSNLGIGLLGVALTDFYKESFQNLLTNKITSPLRMSKTFSSPSFYTTSDTVVQGFTRQGKLVPPATMGVLVSSGGVLTTADDLMKLLHVLVDPPKEWIETISIATSPIQPGFEIGFAIDIKNEGEVTLFSKSGEQAGYSSYIMWNKQNKSGLFILSNLGGSSKKLHELSLLIHKKIFEELK